MFAARRGFERPGEHGRLEPEIQEARSRDFHLLAPLVHVEFGNRVGGELARIHFARLGERHERVALVITELGIGTRTDQNHGGVRVRQDRADGGLELQFNLFVREHGNYLTTDGHEWTRIKFRRGEFHESHFTPVFKIGGSWNSPLRDWKLLFPVFPDDVEHRVGVGGLFER